ncbi:VanZ family protein [Ruminococcus sp.]
MLNFYACPLESVCCIIILLISIWTILEWLLSGRGGKVYLSWRYINIVLYVFSLFLILKMTILGRTVGNREIELLPFYTINTISDNSEAVRMIVMNIILFFPLGLTMPIALGKVKNTICKWLLCIIVGLGISLSVEIIQYYFCIGIAETDDVICNTFGTLLGVMPNMLANYLGKQRKC